MYTLRKTDGAQDGPLFLTFHGTGGTEDQFHEFAQHLRPDAHVVSPRGDVFEQGAARFFRRTGEGVYDMDDLAQRTATMADFIASHRTRTGAGRTIALGYSNGANIAASVALTQPNLIDDLILLHPLIPWIPVLQSGLVGKRILITAGQRDPICPAPLTQQLIDYLTVQGAVVTTHWHPNGHGIEHSEIEAISTFLA